MILRCGNELKVPIQRLAKKVFADAFVQFALAVCWSLLIVVARQCVMSTLSEELPDDDTAPS